MSAHTTISWALLAIAIVLIVVSITTIVITDADYCALKDAGLIPGIVIQRTYYGYCTGMIALAAIIAMNLIDRKAEDQRRCRNE